MSIAKSTIQAMRPPFLLLTPICVMLGVSLASYQGLNINWTNVLLALLAATMAHVSVNTLNEYQDFKSGLDLKTNKTPFSGGSGSLPDNPNAAKAVLISTFITLGLTVFIGCYLAWKVGPSLWVLGAIGVFVIITYTRLINRLPLCCLLASGFCFGIIMVTGGYMVASGVFSTSIILVAMVPFFLVNNLLLLNQYPDADIDRQFGRNHAVIAWGEWLSNRVYLLFVVCVPVLLTIALAYKVLPWLVLISLVPLCLAGISASAMFRYGKGIGNQPQFMAMNVMATLLTPLVMLIALFFSAN